MSNEEVNRTTRQDLIEYFSRQTGHSLSESKQLVDAVIRGIVYLADHSDYLQISGFGRFENRQRRGRVHSNPIQGEHKVIPASTVLWFTAAKGLRQIEEE